MADTTSSNRTPRFERTQIIRLPRLLNMPYTPAEIADALGVSVDTVYRSYIPAGCPAERDEKGRIWIVGVEFRDWAQSLISERRRRKRLPKCPQENTGWCFRCHRCVRIVDAVPLRTTYHMELLRGQCEFCGGKVNRGRAYRGEERAA